MKTKTTENWRKALLSQNASIGDVILNLNESTLQICLIVDEQDKLIGTITDGDVRRGLLSGYDLSKPARLIWNSGGFVAPQDIQRSSVVEIMKINKIHQLPLVDANEIVVGLYLWDQIIPTFEDEKLPNPLVIMAGGKGLRLRPHTENCPKPMLLVHGKPMLEHIIEKAKREGFTRIIVTTHYLGHMIEEYFGDGHNLDVEISYIREVDPLGTAGALKLIKEKIDTPFLVSNGDVLTAVNYKKILQFHEEKGSFATMAVRRHEYFHPYGVVEVDGLKITGFKEKPVFATNVNAGVYVLDPSALDTMEKGIYLDMPNLFENLHAQGKNIMAYPIHEDWLDVGRESDLENANL